jgi:hypothetical protein
MPHTPVLWKPPARPWGSAGQVHGPCRTAAPILPRADTSARPARPPSWTTVSSVHFHKAARPIKRTKPIAMITNPGQFALRPPGVGGSSVAPAKRDRLASLSGPRQIACVIMNITPQKMSAAPSHMTSMIASTPFHRTASKLLAVSLAAPTSRAGQIGRWLSVGQAWACMRLDRPHDGIASTRAASCAHRAPYR